MQESIQQTKKAYSTPNLCVVKLSSTDVLTTSPTDYTEDERQFLQDWLSW